MNDFQNKSDTNDQARDSQPGDSAIEHVVEQGLLLGRLWASHGLTVGRLALETSARSLEHTAALLGELRRAIATDRDDARSS